MLHLTRRATLAGLAAFAATPTCAAPKVLRDVAYGGHALQRYDVYLPESTPKGPMVVFMHGGGWQYGDKGNDAVWEAKAAHWTGRGLGFVSVNTRLLPEADPLQQATDLARGISHIQANAASWGLDTKRMALMGHSAGAHLVALLGADPGLARQWGAHPWAATVPLDTEVYDAETTMRRRPSRIHRAAFGESRAFWERASPRARLQTGTAPFLLVCSTKRRGPLPAARAFARQVKARGGRAEVLEVALSHSAINSTLGMPGPYTDKVDQFLASTGVG